jgi:hypothetical protein
MGEEPNHIRRADDLVLHKSFNTLLHGAHTLYSKHPANLRADHLWPGTILLIQVHKSGCLKLHISWRAMQCIKRCYRPKQT